MQAFKPEDKLRRKMFAVKMVDWLDSGLGLLNRVYYRDESMFYDSGIIIHLKKLGVFPITFKQTKSQNLKTNNNNNLLNFEIAAIIYGHFVCFCSRSQLFVNTVLNNNFSKNPLSISKKCKFRASVVKLIPVMLFILEFFLL